MAIFEMWLVNRIEQSIFGIEHFRPTTDDKVGDYVINSMVKIRTQHL